MIRPFIDPPQEKAARKWSVVRVGFYALAIKYDVDDVLLPNASLDGCSESGQIMACSYSNDVCSYVLVRDGCGLTGWEESSWYCLN